MSDVENKAGQPDELLAMLQGLTKDRDRVRRIDPSNARAIVNELDGTVLSIVNDVLLFLAGFRNWSWEAYLETQDRLQALEEASGESGSSGLDQEEIDKLLRLCGEAEALADVQLMNTSLKDEVKQKLKDTIALAHECLEILSQFGDEGDEEEPVEEESESEAPDAADATGG